MDCFRIDFVFIDDTIRECFFENRNNQVSAENINRIVRRAVFECVL